MPYLGDFLGHLLSEITIGRSQADAETIRLANIYSRDPVLKHFAVPRFRLPTLTLRVPVAVTSMAEPTQGEPPPIEALQARTALFTVLDQQARQLAVTIPEQTRAAIAKEIDSVLATDATGLSRDVQRLADTIVPVALGAVSRDPEVAPNFGRLNERFAQLREGTVAELVRQRFPPPRLSVAVTSGALREAGPALVNLELQISEEAVEWTMVESDGQPTSRLVPE